MWGHVPQTLLDKFVWLRGPQRESRNLEGKVTFLFHFPLGKWLKKKNLHVLDIACFSNGFQHKTNPEYHYHLYYILPLVLGLGLLNFKVFGAFNLEMSSITERKKKKCNIAIH
jgi:hypothetical protein